MSAGFDWKPLLTEGEVVLWEGRPSRLKLFAGSAVLTAMATAAWLMAMGDIAQAPGGSECLTDDCPTADRKAGLVAVVFGPVSLLLCGTFMLISPFIRHASAITSKRVLSVSRPLLRKKAKFEQMPVRGAKAKMDGVSFLRTVRAFGPHPTLSYVDQSVVLWARSKAELKKAIAVIEQLSLGHPPVQGPNP
ncbi:MAG: hypothetical protein MUE83_06070 [Tabrizicola sp.]|jgi:hypothetical protein|nr:hypothetical protein [Tabrizicola sp.]